MFLSYLFLIFRLEVEVEKLRRENGQLLIEIERECMEKIRERTEKVKLLRENQELSEKIKIVQHEKNQEQMEKERLFEEREKESRQKDLLQLEVKQLKEEISRLLQEALPVALIEQEDVTPEVSIHLKTIYSHFFNINIEN